MNKLRFLIHRTDDRETYLEIMLILNDAVRDYPDNFTLTVNEPGIIDHYGYHDSMLSSVILSEEYNTMFYRLTIRPGLHDVFDRILSAVLSN